MRLDRHHQHRHEAEVVGGGVGDEGEVEVADVDEELQWLNQIAGRLKPRNYRT